MKIINLTPHTINFYSEEDVIATQKGPYTSYNIKDGAQVVRSFPSMGVARAEETVEIVGYDDLDGLKVARKRKTLGAPIGLPDNPGADELILVSKITYDAAMAHGYPFVDQLRLVNDTCRNADGVIVGAVSMAVL